MRRCLAKKKLFCKQKIIILAISKNLYAEELSSGFLSSDPKIGRNQKEKKYINNNCKCNFGFINYDLALPAQFRISSIQYLKIQPKYI